MKNPSKIIQPSAKSQANRELESLVEALRSGRGEVLEEIISKTERTSYALAISILKDPDLAKDALQDSYFIAYQRIGQLRENAAFKAWLYKIVTRSCHDILKKRSREIQTDLQDRDDLVTPETSSNPSTSVTDQAALKATFSKLPDIDRQTIALREICHLSYEEMSKVLAIPIGTVRSRLAKARKRFIKAYRREEQS